MQPPSHPWTATIERRHLCRPSTRRGTKAIRRSSPITRVASRPCHRVSSVSKHTGVNNTLHTGAPSSNMNNLTHIICSTDLLRSPNETVNTKFALINTRSVRNKADFIKDYIVEHHIDIVALTETWLSHDDKAEINVLTAGGYNLCHLPRRNRRGGGVGLLFKSTFNMISETPLMTDTFEGLSVALQCPETNSNVRVCHLPSTVVIAVP